MALPKVSQVENADVNALFPLNPNNNNSVNNNNTVVVNDGSWYCSGYNGRHREEHGYHCVERTVGGEPPGYFGIIPGSQDEQRKF
jgi:hypothetical protein